MAWSTPDRKRLLAEAEGSNHINKTPSWIKSEPGIPTSHLSGLSYLWMTGLHRTSSERVAQCRSDSSRLRLMASSRMQISTQEIPQGRDSQLKHINLARSLWNQGPFRTFKDTTLNETAIGNLGPGGLNLRGRGGAFGVSVIRGVYMALNSVWPRRSCARS